MNKTLTSVVCIFLWWGFALHATDSSSLTTLSRINAIEQAKKHPIDVTQPAVNFFEGALLGNGGLGAVVTTRPDAVVIHFGHNDVWDIRIAEDNSEKIGTFRELFEKIDAIPDTLENLQEVTWYREYLDMARQNYAKPYPRPFPCGSVVLWFDRREAELIGYRLDVATGVCEVGFLIDGRHFRLELFTDMGSDCLWARMVDDGGKPAVSPFVYVTVIPDPETPKEFPQFTASKDVKRGTISFRQVLPFEEVTAERPYRGNPRDRAFRLSVRVNGSFRTDTARQTARENVGLGIIPSGGLETGTLMGMIDRSQEFAVCIRLDQGMVSVVGTGLDDIPEPSPGMYAEVAGRSVKVWEDYWSKSGITLDDSDLERTWYHNLYFLRCALRPGVTCPGLFANWSYRNIGTAWHGDYHMNYNTQQPFWVTFSSNHTELHLPYVDMVEKTLLPVSRKWAREYYDMRGAFFPHSAYPVEMTMMPYPLPHWGWEVFETPWSVQSLWWHYIYTMDEVFLRERAFPVMKEAVLFLVDYMKRSDAHGARWGDSNYHIFPSVPPELYALQPGFRKNYDTTADLTLTRFVFNAFIESCRILRYEKNEKELLSDIREILGHYPDYPTATSNLGKVFVSVEGEDPEVVYNVPASLMTVFPGEHHGLHSPPDIFGVAANTYRNQQNEGGNDIVFLNLQAARLGFLDLDRFKRQIDYCLLPNGTCVDKVLQIHGRYTNNTPFDFMERMGIWFENFALPVVINECMLQSYTGELRFFPNWPEDRKAEFRSLRAVGAFLVSASWRNGAVEWIEVLSEAGGDLRIISSWVSGAVLTRSTGERFPLTGELLRVTTQPGEMLQFREREK